MKKIVTTTLVLLIGLSGTAFSKEKNNNKEINEAKVYGSIQNMPKNFTGVWVVNKKNIEVNNQTKFEGNKSNYKKGIGVKIEAKLLGNKFVAEEIETYNTNSIIKEKTEIDLYGSVESMPKNFTGVWVVNKKNIEVNDKTKFEGNKSDYKQGIDVKIETELVGNKYIAEEIEIKD